MPNFRQILGSYQKFLLSALITALLAIFITPTAHPLDLSDILRVAPSVIQVVQLSNISDREEVDLGRQINRSITREVRISRDRAANELVNNIGQELVSQSDRPNIPYTFQVVN